eukprot:GGOE01015906.1.p3 GENE.GGOE01015906.1~~GGOE01015906.1.p3  ORF type:complete len:132 (+),score=16.24 GGOE01015906.1:225-620(+)
MRKTERSICLFAGAISWQTSSKRILPFGKHTIPWWCGEGKEAKERVRVCMHTPFCEDSWISTENQSSDCNTMCQRHAECKAQQQAAYNHHLGSRHSAGREERKHISHDATTARTKRGKRGKEGRRTESFTM